jgi:IPT/TIG domain
VLLLAGLLAMVASAPVSPSNNALAATPSPTAPQVRNLQLAPARVVHLQGLPASPTVTHPNLGIPYLPKDQASYAAAKQLANQGKTGRRSAVVAVPSGRAQVAGSSAPQTHQQLAGFPVMDLSRQMRLFGNDQNVAPPDTQLAAGPIYLVEADNSALTVWTKSGSLVASADLNVFFSEPIGYAFTDPRILYDAESSRWFLSGLAFTTTNDSKIYLAVSATSDPTGSWIVYVVSSATGVIGDQPMTGVNSDKVVISWNDFTGTSPATATFSGQGTSVLQKSDLVSGVGVHISAFSPDMARFRVVPAQSLAPTTTEWLSYNTGAPTIGVVAITGTPSSNNVVWTEHDPAAQATTVPPSPRQPSGVPVVQDNDDRFVSAVWQSGTLWVAGTNGCVPAGDSTTRSCMGLVAISTGGTVPTVAQDFDAAQLGVDLYYPAVTFDSSGDLFVGYSASSPTLDPSALAVDTLAASPTTFENPITLASGQTSYLLGAINRWGDYSAAAPDPSNPADVWVTAEYQASATNAGDWGTATGKLAIQPSITTLSPNFGPADGGTSVTITGSHFQSGAAVSFGSNPATNVIGVSREQITATTPAAAVGPVNVTVSQPDGTFVTAPAAYMYLASPTVSLVVPNNGPTGGGTVVTITGANFTGATAVKFGAAAAATFTASSATEIAATNPPGSGTVDVTVTTAGGTSVISAADRFTYASTSPPSAYTAVTPVRLLDTRSVGGPLGPAGSRNLTVAGATPGAPAGATAVVVNVTVTNTTAGSYLGVYPAGGTQPFASNLNWVAGATIPNLVSVQVGAGGAITIFNSVGSTDVVVDLEGYYAAPSGTAGGEVALPPARITDTRPGSGLPNAGHTLGAGGTLNVQVTGAGGVPATGVSAAILNVTVTNTTNQSFLTVWPAGATRPTASNLNWTASVTIPNRVFVPVSATGQISVFNNVGSADVIIDVAGYFTDATATGKLFTAQSPVRIADTRMTGGTLGPGGTFTLQVSGLAGVPSGASAVVLNVTVTNTTNQSFLTVYPSTGSRPLASDLNWVSGQTIPNMVVATLGTTGAVTFFNNVGSADVVVDLAGCYG